MKKNTFTLLSIMVVILGILITRGLLPGNTPETDVDDVNQQYPNASPLAIELYQLRNPFIGDASANGRILSALLPQNETGPYHMELETAEKPYVLQVILRDMPEDTTQMDELLTQQGLLILALIDNADAVQLTYPLETGDEPVVSAVRVNREALYETLGVEAEEFELTPDVLDQLISNHST